MISNSQKAEQYLQRAAELRANAGMMNGREVRKILIELAESYERMSGYYAGARRGLG